MKEMLKKEILVGVIAAIIMTIFFEPIIRWLWGILTFLSIQSYSGLVNSVYRSAAMGHRNFVDVLIFMIIVGTGTITSFFPRFSSGNPISSLMKRLSPKMQKAFDVVLILGLLITASYLIIATFADLQLNTSFDQRLTVLAPALSDQEYEEIRASWAGMETREDFKTINFHMETLAKERSIDLPKLLLP